MTLQIDYGLLDLAREHGINVGPPQEPELFIDVAPGCIDCGANCTCGVEYRRDVFQPDNNHAHHQSRLRVIGPRVRDFKGIIDQNNIPEEREDRTFNSLVELNRELQLLTRKTMENVSEQISENVTRGRRRQQKLADISRTEAIKEGCALPEMHVREQFKLQSRRVRQRKKHVGPNSQPQQPTIKQSIAAYIMREFRALGLVKDDCRSVETHGNISRAELLANDLTFVKRYQGSRLESVCKACVVHTLNLHGEPLVDACKAMRVSVNTVRPILKLLSPIGAT